MDRLTSQLGQVVLGAFGGALAVVYLRIATWRDAVATFGASLTLAWLAPEPVAEILGWSDRSHWLLAFLFGLSGRSLALHVARFGPSAVLTQRAARERLGG